MGCGEVKMNVSYNGLLTRSFLYISFIFLIFGTIQTIYSGEAGVFMFMAPMIIVPIVFAGVTRLWSGKLTILSVLFFIIGMVFIFGMMGPSSIKMLLDPSEFGGFMMASTVIYGSFIALITGIQAFRYRNTATPVIAPKIYTTTVAVFQFVPIAILAVSALYFTSTSDVTNNQKETNTVLSIDNFVFTNANPISASKGIVVENNEVFVPHHFTVDELGIDILITAQREIFVDLSNYEKGEYKITCSLEGHEDMDGTLKLI
tara:strand:- start:283 stop:1062 length:780 start_codon:yes stop_codon:yes gene_type:complete